MSISQWSTTASNNASGVTNVNWAEGQAPSTVNDSARNMMADVAALLGQASGSIPEYLTSVAGTNTVTATGPAQMASYVAGQRFTFIPANTNTGATTINITPSGGAALGAKNVFCSGAACVGGELVANVPTTILYDGTQFHLLGVEKAPTVQVFTTTGANTWNKPTGLRAAIIEVFSGGGGGGGGAADGGSGGGLGGGGGAGGYGRKRVVAASLGSTETATVGALGGGGAAGVAGTTGGTSSFGAHISVTGGVGGSGGPDGTTNTAGGAGGASSSADINGTGARGANATGNRAGAGGATLLGGGGLGGVSSGGASATGKGAGGGGGGINSAGGSGSDGIIIVTEFY